MSSEGIEAKSEVAENALETILQIYSSVVRLRSVILGVYVKWILFYKFGDIWCSTQKESIQFCLILTKNFEKPQLIVIIRKKYTFLEAPMIE